MVNVHEWLDENYPKEGRNNITEIINGRHFKWNFVNKLIETELLEGELILTNWPNLKKISLNNNQLDKLAIIGCPKLTIVDVSDNQLTDLTCEQPELLTDLDIGNNKFASQDLTFFSRFANLESLWLGYNSFYGSLKPLKCLIKLKKLDISHTDIDSDLEHLPENLEKIFCYINESFPTKVQKLRQSLEPFKVNSSLRKEAFAGTNYTGRLIRTAVAKAFPVNTSFQDRVNNPYYYNYQVWKRANFSKLAQQELQDQLKLLQEERAKLTKRIATLEELTQENQRLIKEQKEKIANNHYHFFTEEEKLALQELIKVHRTYEEAKKLKEDTDELYEKFHSLRKKLKVKLGKEFIEAVQSVLTDLEELYQREWDLQNQLKEKGKLPNKIGNIEKYIAEIKRDIKALETSPNQVVNNYITIGDIEVKGGHAVIGNTTGNQADLSYNKHATTIEEISEEIEIFEAKIKQTEPYGIPSSSKPN